MDFTKVPLIALSNETKQIISTLLNPPKVLPTENGLPRDWRGLAHLFNIPGESVPRLSSHTDPLSLILEAGSKTFTFHDLTVALETIERWDVINDIGNSFEKDAQNYFSRIEGSAEDMQRNVDLQLLTVDDEYRVRAGLQKQNYHAFLLYADEDSEFANEMISRLEAKNLKICTKNNLLAGASFQHETIMELIAERCHRLLVVISEDFLKSTANNFFLAYGEAVGIDRQQRKLIACIYKPCTLPYYLSFKTNLYYSTKPYHDFWGRLSRSIQINPSPLPNRPIHTYLEEEANTALERERSENITREREDVENNETSVTEVVGVTISSRSRILGRLGKQKKKLKQGSAAESGEEDRAEAGPSRKSKSTIFELLRKKKKQPKQGNNEEGTEESRENLDSSRSSENIDSSRSSVNISSRGSEEINSSRNSENLDNSLRSVNLNSSLNSENLDNNRQSENLDNSNNENLDNRNSENSNLVESETVSSNCVRIYTKSNARVEFGKKELNSSESRENLNKNSDHAKDEAGPSNCVENNENAAEGNENQEELNEGENNSTLNLPSPPSSSIELPTPTSTQNKKKKSLKSVVSNLWKSKDNKK